MLGDRFGRLDGCKLVKHVWIVSVVLVAMGLSLAYSEAQLASGARASADAAQPRIRMLVKVEGTCAPARRLQGQLFVALFLSDELAMTHSN